MNAIAACVKTIKDINSSHGAEEKRQLAELTEQAFHQHPTITKSFTTPDSTTPSVPRVQTTNPKSTQSVPRVQGTAPNQQLTQSMSQSIELATRQIERVFSRTKHLHKTFEPEEMQTKQRSGCTINPRCNWMPPSGKYLPHIAPADAMVIDFGVKN